MTSLAMQTQYRFAGIQELSLDEMDHVAGGPVPVVVGVVVGVGALIGYVAGSGAGARSSDDCTKTTTYVYDSNGRVVRTVTTTSCD